MKKNIFLCFSVLLTTFCWSQVTVNAPLSVEVGINNQFSFTFSPNSSDYPSGSSSYKLTAWFINDGSSNMDNSGYGSYSNNLESINYYSINESQILNLPIKWEDNSNSLTSEISIDVNVSYYGIDEKGHSYLAGSRIHSFKHKVDINRIFTPTINSSIILSCCIAPITFTASNYGTSNVFNWSINNGVILNGEGTSSISVTPLANSSPVIANCTVSRNIGSPTYTKFKSSTFAKTARTINITSSNSAYICAGISKIFQIDNQCGITGVNWSTTNSTVSSETIINGKRQVTVTPNANLTSKDAITVSATANYSGGCIATNSLAIYIGTPRTTLPQATCYTTNAPCSVIATPNNNYLNFTLTAPLGNYVPSYEDWEWQKISGNFYFLSNITGQYNAISRNSPEAYMYLTGANPTNNPLKFKTRVKSECGWGDWTEYVWNDGTTTEVTPLPSPKYFTVSPNPGSYYININIINPINLPPNSIIPIPSFTASLYDSNGTQRTNSITLVNYSGTLGFMSNGPYSTSLPNGIYFLKIIYGTYSETHKVIKI